jgi:hypothetical protein
LTTKEDRKSASKFILEKGFAKDVPGHSLVLTPKGNELLRTLDDIKKSEIELAPNDLGVRQDRSNKVQVRE